MLTQREGQKDFVKLLDFGLAKVPPELRMKARISSVPGPVSPQLTKVGALYGTPGYMAPEQATSEAVDGRCDLYAMGSILYEMSTGRTPFDGNTVLELIDAHLSNPLPPMHLRAPVVAVPEPVEALVRRLMAKRPEERFRDARELLTALGKLIQEIPGSPLRSDAAPTSDSLILTVLPGTTPPVSPVAARKATIVAMPQPQSSFWSQLGELPKTMPPPLRQLPLGIFVVGFLGLILAAIALPWFLR